MIPSPRSLTLALLCVLAVIIGWFAASIHAHGQENFSQTDYRWVNGSRDAGAARVAATANIATLAGLQVIDSVQTVAGDYILLTAQTDATKNGLWVAATGNWTRPLHFTSFANRPPGTLVYVAAGTVNAGKWYVMTNASRPTIGTDALTFSPFSLPGSGYLNETDIDTLAELNAIVADATLLSTTAAAAAYQPLDSDLTDLADGTLSASAIDSAITRDSEWDTFAKINAATTDTDAVLDTDIGLTVQPVGAYLEDGDHWTLDGIDLYRDSAGFVGIGTSDPLHLFHIASSGPARLLIEADTDNNVEQDTAALILSQDGGAVVADIGFTVNTGLDYLNNAYTGISGNDLLIAQRYSSAGVAFGIGTTTRGRFSSTGLTVAGAVSATGQVKSNSQNVLDVTSIGSTVDAFAAQVSGGEITAATETALRNYAPADIKSFIDQHAGGGGGDLNATDIDTLAELNGILTDATLVSGAGSDDLGNHTATQDLDLDSNDIIGLDPANDDALTKVAVIASDGTLKYRTAASISAAGGATSGLIDFAEQGGVEGSSATPTERQDNWALLKTLEGQQDTNGLPIYFPGGDWYFLPAIDAADNSNNPWGHDHIEADDGATILRGAGKDATRLHLPNTNYWFFLRQRAWNASVLIQDLTLTDDGVHSQIFTASSSTDKLTATAHGFLGVYQYLKFTTTDTLPAPLAENTQSTVSRLAVVPCDANTFFVKNWLTAATVFTLDATGNTLDSVGHGLTNGTLFVPETTGSLSGTGIDPATRYFVVNANTDDFQLATTSGGSAIDITAAGTGTHQGYPVTDITDAGTGTHTLYEQGERAWFSAGYSIGASEGVDASDGGDEFNTTYINVRFIGASPFAGVSSKGAKNLTMLRCDVFDNQSVAVNVYVNDAAGTEDVDWRRPHVLIDGCRFEERTLTRPPFGNHFVYLHPQPHAKIVNSTFINCWNNAVQFQGESALGGAGAQIVANNYFRDNELHLITAQAQDDRGRCQIVANTFEGIGSIEFRSDTLFANNFVRHTTTPALSFTDAVTDDTERKETFEIANNTIITAGVSGANAICAFVRDDAHIVKMKGNIFRRDPALSAATQIFIGNSASSNGDTDSEWYFEDETYSYDTTGSNIGWFIYPAKFYEFRNCNFDGPKQIVTTSLNSSGTEIRFIGCRWNFEDASGDDKKAAIFLNHTGYTLTGRNNFLGNASYFDNPAGLTGRVEFGTGRNPSTITAAATVYIDPSYNETAITGTTTIDTITLGVTGNIQANAAADDHGTLWAGSITLIVPSGLTISAAGNIANGPYTSTSADAITLIYQPATENWLIRN